jgi:hypothetical protein
MGRKHKNASQRDHSKLSVRGVKVQYNRMPSIVLDMQDLGVWQHSVAISAALWCRDRYSSSVGVNVDPYGVWQACRFIVTSSGSRVRPCFDESVIPTITSAAKQSVQELGQMRGFSDEMIRQSVKEVTPIPLLLASFWHTVSLIVGSLDRLGSSILLRSGEFRPVWLVPHRIEHQVRANLPDFFLLVEQSAPDVVLKAMKPLDIALILYSASSQPHEFVAAARATGCIGVIAHSLDGVTLGYSANDRCYQVVNEGTEETLVLMAPHLRVRVQDGQAVLPEVLIRDTESQNTHSPGTKGL